MSWLAEKLKIDNPDYTIKGDRIMAANIYGLLAIGMVFGVTLIISVLMNYARFSAVAGTWLESHFRFQIVAFWFFIIALMICGSFIVLYEMWWPSLLFYTLYGLAILRGYLYLRKSKPYPEWNFVGCENKCLTNKDRSCEQSEPRPIRLLDEPEGGTMDGTEKTARIAP